MATGTTKTRDLITNRPDIYRLLFLHKCDNTPGPDFHIESLVQPWERSVDRRRRATKFKGRSAHIRNAAAAAAARSTRVPFKGQNFLNFTDTWNAKLVSKLIAPSRRAVTSWSRHVTVQWRARTHTHTHAHARPNSAASQTSSLYAHRWPSLLPIIFPPANIIIMQTSQEVDLRAQVCIQGVTKTKHISYRHTRLPFCSYWENIGYCTYWIFFLFFK